MKQRLAIIGSGEMALQVKHYAEIDGRYLVVGFFADYPNSMKEVEGLPIIGSIADVKEIHARGMFDCIFIAIGYKHLHFKTELYNQLSQDIPFATIIASPTYIDNSSTIGKDVIIYPGCIIDKNAIIENNVVLNLGATICHDSKICNGSFIGARVAISGFCQVGEHCFLGTNSTLIDNVSICDETKLGASTVVIDNIKESGLYVGNPSRKIKQL